MRSRYTTALAVLLSTLAVAAWPAAAGAAGGKKTHLGVPPKGIVNLMTFQITNDNSFQPFFYDRDGNQAFSVPEGWSFVATDVFILPGIGSLGSGHEMYVIVDFGGRWFSAHYASAEVRHFALAGAFVVPGGAALRAKSVSYSTLPCDVQVLGYFVKGEGLALGEPAFPVPAP